ncbi:unnamed protein product [Musa hybrid cultivar]
MPDVIVTFLAYPPDCRLQITEGLDDGKNEKGVLCQSAIQAKFYCPFNECSALLEAGDGEEAITVSECPHWNRMLCAYCKVPWHHGPDCKEFQGLEEGERGREDLLPRELAAKLRWQRCPQGKCYCRED